MRTLLAARIVAVATLALTALPAAAEQWVRAGPGPEVYVRGIRVYPNTPAPGQATVLAATLGAGLVKVVDDGTTFTTSQLNSGLPNLRLRAIGAVDATTLYVAVDGVGVYKSTNGGATWAQAHGSGATKLGCTAVRNMVVRSATEVWALGGCTRDSGVWRSLDGGATWARLGAGTIPDDVAINSLAFNGTGATTVGMLATARDGLFRTNDNGATWVQTNNGLPADGGPNRLSAFNVTYLASAAQMLVYVEGRGIYRSTDSGASWTASGTGLPAEIGSHGGISRLSSTTFYIGTDKGPVYRSTDGGLNWAAWGASNGEITSYARGVTSDATLNNRFWVHGINGLARTNDNGATFSSVPLAEGYLASFGMAANSAAAYLVAQSIYKVANVFDPDWNVAVEVGAGLPGNVDSVVVDPQVAGTLYATVPSRGLVYKSVDDGTTWTPLAAPGIAKGTGPTMEFSASQPNVIFVGLDNKFGTVSGGGVKVSLDAGATWADASSGLTTPEARQVNSIASNASANGFYLATDAGIFKSPTGTSWTPVLVVNDASSQPLPFGSVRVDPLNGAVVWATGAHVSPDGTVLPSSGVYRSNDAGATWTLVHGGVRAIAVRPEASGRVVVGVSRDLAQPAFLASIDGGATWQAFTNGLTTGDAAGLGRNKSHGAAYLVMGLTASGSYILARRPLNVTIAGAGTVAQVGGGLSCTSACSNQYFDYELVALAATPAAGKRFAGWSGACSGNASCNVRMDAPRSVGATFVARSPGTDLNADGKADILYRNASTGQVYRLSMDGFNVASGGMVYVEPNTAWSIVAEGDVNADGTTDLIWRHSASGQVYVMTLGADGTPSGGAIVHAEPNAAWRIVHTPDLDGDGKSDLLWWNNASGQVYAMLLDGAAIKSQGMVYTEPNTSWRIVVTGDFAGSGKRNQLLWRNVATGQLYQMTVTASGGGYSVSGAMIYHEPDTAWKVIASADFDGDGRSDLLWRRDGSGQVYAMLMNGASIASQGMVYVEGNPAWKIVAQGDYDGDGRADLLWRNDTSGHVYMMRMNGLAVAAQAMVYVEPNTAWKVLGPWEYGLASGILP